MKFIVSGRNVEIPEVVKERLTKKIGKLEKFFNPDTEVYATFSTEKNEHILEVTIPFGGTVFRAEEKNDDMFACIDKIVDVLERQARKNKTKCERRIKGTVNKGSSNSSKSYLQAGTERGKIVEIQKYSVKPMTVDDAIKLMDLEENDFFIFSNAETDQVNLVYRLKNGKYGLVEPDL